MSFTSRLLVTVSLAASAAYFSGQLTHPLPGSVVWKGLAVSPLAVLAWLRCERLLALALALGSLGDVLLDLDPSLFVPGLGAFLAGHVVYTVLWVRNWPRPLRVRWIPLAVLALFTGALCAWLIPSLGAMAVPVVFYMLAITAMVAAAILTPFRWVAIGAALFLLSDALLGIHKFRAPVPYRDFLVWTTYYLGQVAIAQGYLMHKPGESSANAGS